MNKPIWYKVHKAVDISVKLQTNGDEVTKIMLGPTGCTETSLTNYHYTLRNIPEDCRSQVGTITMVTLKMYSSEIFPFHKGTVKLLTSACSLSVPSPLHPKSQTDLHAIRYHSFEGHLYAVSFNPQQSAITTWRTHSSLPCVWRFGVPEWSHVYQLLSLVCGTCPFQHLSRSVAQAVLAHSVHKARLQ
jgi:hypothetical protein